MFLIYDETNTAIDYVEGSSDLALLRDSLSTGWYLVEVASEDIILDGEGAPDFDAIAGAATPPTGPPEEPLPSDPESFLSTAVPTGSGYLDIRLCRDLDELYIWKPDKFNSSGTQGIWWTVHRWKDGSGVNATTVNPSTTMRRFNGGDDGIPIRRQLLQLVRFYADHVSTEVNPRWEVRRRVTTIDFVEELGSLDRIDVNLDMTSNIWLVDGSGGQDLNVLWRGTDACDRPQVTVEGHWALEVTP